MARVRFDNWTMQNVGAGIVVTSYYVMGGETRMTQLEPLSPRTPVFRPIAISNVTIAHAKTLATIDRLPPKSAQRPNPEDTEPVTFSPGGRCSVSVANGLR